MHALFQHSSQQRTRTIELEMANQMPEDSAVSGTLSPQKVDVLAKWFGLEPAQIHQWQPGVSVLCAHFESLFKPFLEDPNAAIWQILDGEQRERTARDCWSLLYQFCDALEKIEDTNPDIGHIYQKMNFDAGNTSQRGRNTVSNPQAISIYAVLCWTTMTLQPSLELPVNGSTDWAFAKGEPTIKIESLHRPISVLFQRIYNALPSNRWKCPVGAPVADKNKTLHVSSLNYKCLKTIGSISIKWVDNICNHLDFDAKRRKLSLFRFPTLCVLSTSGKPPKLIRRAQRSLFNHDSNDPITIIQMHQEVLMSYRLLFGKSKSSCRLISEELDDLKKEDNFDVLLDTLCVKSRRRVNRILPHTSWPVTCLDTDKMLLEDSAYSAQDDFPFFGQRLVKLQEFNDRQTASGWKDLWRDTRNPLQWYTFWAVLVVGGVSILFSVLQFVVGCLQLWVAIRQSNPGPSN